MGCAQERIGNKNVTIHKKQSYITQITENSQNSILFFVKGNVAKYIFMYLFHLRVVS